MRPRTSVRSAASPPSRAAPASATAMRFLGFAGGSYPRMSPSSRAFSISPSRSPLGKPLGRPRLNPAPAQTVRRPLRAASKMELTTASMGSSIEAGMKPGPAVTCRAQSRMPTRERVLGRAVPPERAVALRQNVSWQRGCRSRRPLLSTGSVVVRTRGTQAA